MSQSNWKKWGGSGGFRSTQNLSRGHPTSKNPIFESWIMEWLEDADAKDSKMKYVYAKALKSLRKYPLSLKSGKECSILENFGAHMCKMIDQRMAKEDIAPEPDSPQSVGFCDDNDNEPGPSHMASRPKKAKAKAAATTTTTATATTTSYRVTGKPAKKTKSSKTMTNGSQTSTISSSSARPMSDVIDISFDSDENDPVPRSSPPAAKKKKTGKEYVPAYRSGGYAILLAMYAKGAEPGYRGFMTKTELLGDAQQYTDSSMTRPDTTKSAHYTAWNSMKILIQKDYINKAGNPAKYMLTMEGRELADKLYKAEYGVGLQLPQQQQQSSQMSSASSDRNTGRSSQYEDSDEETEVCGPVYEAVKLTPGKFEVVLYVDTCETSGKSKSQEVVNELQKNGVTVHVTRLSVGDFAWVCREVSASTANRNRLTLGNQAELVLPYVVERKRSDDLASSIRDGRYREQKYRLKNTKLQVIYLIEEYGKGDWGLQPGALDQAVASTQIKSDFQIQKTHSIKDTCAYLTFMTRRLKSRYESKTVIGRNMTDYSSDSRPDDPSEVFLLLFSDFNDFSNKKTNWNVQSLFARQLIRMKGMSVDKAYAIVTLYPTLRDLMRAYGTCLDDKEKQMLLANVRFGASERRIGPGISRKIALLYNTASLQ